MVSAVFSGGYTVDAKLTVKPVNTVALVGTSVRLNSTTNWDGPSEGITWYRIIRNGDDQLTDRNCESRGYQEYNFIRNSAGQCDLVIIDVSYELAATYRCFDPEGSTADAQLTVVRE